MLVAQLALAGAALGTLAWAPDVQAQTAADPARHYDIPAGPLAAALNRFADESGVLLSAPSESTQGKASPGLQGSHGVPSGFATLLRGSGLEALRQADGSYGLRAVSAAGESSALPTITVSGKAPGSTTEGTGSYTTWSTSSSTRLNLTPQETPQPISVITRQRMDDQGLVGLNDIMDATPGITVKAFGVGGDGPQIWARGASITNFQIDGIPSATSMSNYLQSSVLYDRVEVVKGATGMMSGLGTPSATINMIRKRPTKEAQASVTAEAGSWSRHGTGADLSRPLNDDGSVRGRLVADYKRQGAWTDNYRQDYGVLYGIVEADLGPRTLLT
ncbi:MAG: TonB-dependent siderophore receptor, partial [Comamonadaceae bacterium]